MTTNDNFDSLWANLRTAVTEARTAKPKRINMVATSPKPRVMDDTDIYVEQDSIVLVRTGIVMRAFTTKDDAIKLAANLIAMHTQDK